MRFDLETLKDMTGVINQEVKGHLTQTMGQQQDQTLKSNTLVSTFMQRDNLDDDAGAGQQDDIDDLRRD